MSRADGDDAFDFGAAGRGEDAHFERSGFENSGFENSGFEVSRDAQRPSLRAQRLLVRVLLVLRGESRRLSSPARDARRAEILADRILADFPRRVLPIGLAAIAIVVLACLFPLVRDALPAAQLGAQPTPVAAALESGLRTQGEAMSEGIETLRAIVRPFAGAGTTESAASEANDAEEFSAGRQAATAPFTQS